MSNYSLAGFWSSGKRGEVGISASEFQQALAAKDLLMTYLAFEEAYDVMILNYVSFENAMLASVVENMVDRRRGRVELEDLRRDIDRHLVNILAAGEMYSDHVLRRARRGSGRRSGQAALVEAQFQNARDRFLGFRAIEQLRNAVLHYSLPITSWTQGGAWVDRDGPNARLQHTSSVAFEPKLLSDDRRFPQELIADLQGRANKDGLVSWLPMVREYVEGLSIAHQGVRDIVATTEDSSVRSIAALITALRLKFEQDEPPFIADVLERGGDGKWLSKVAILFDYEDRIEILRRKNRPLINLHLREIVS